jgi:hypothetical protein
VEPIQLVESARHTRDGAIIYAGLMVVIGQLPRGVILRELHCGGTVSSLFIEGHMLTQILHSSLFGVPLCRLDCQEAGLIDCTI